jgi:hypothetical protein
MDNWTAISSKETTFLEDFSDEEEKAPFIAMDGTIKRTFPFFYVILFI